MSLMRAFTTRRNKAEELNNVHIGRAASNRRGRPVHRSQISSPVELVSTTNPLSYEAPSIGPEVQHRAAPSSSSSSSHSVDESETSTLNLNSDTDASSIDNSPVSPEPEPNHLSCYFKPAVDTKTPTRSPSLSSRPASTDAPAIPQRVPSHSKKAHERIHRQRSVQRLMSPPASIARRTSQEMFSMPVEAPKENPFGSELAQLDECQEDFSFAVRDAQKTADAEYMDSRGLAHFGASDYLTEIHSLLYDVFLADEQPTWI